MIKYAIKRSNTFKKQYKKLLRQEKDISKMEYVIEMLANGEKLDSKYKDHILMLINIIRNVENVILSQIGY